MGRYSGATTAVIAIDSRGYWVPMHLVERRDEVLFRLGAGNVLTLQGWRWAGFRRLLAASYRGHLTSSVRRVARLGVPVEVVERRILAPHLSGVQTNDDEEEPL